MDTSVTSRIPKVVVYLEALVIYACVAAQLLAWSPARAAIDTEPSESAIELMWCTGHKVRWPDPSTVYRSPILKIERVPDAERGQDWYDDLQVERSRRHEEKLATFLKQKGVVGSRFWCYLASRQTLEWMVAGSARSDAANPQNLRGEIDWSEAFASPPPPDREAKLTSLTLRYGDAKPGLPGYRSATINLNYRFVSCMGEVHVAYSLDRESLKADDTYILLDGSAIPAGESRPKGPSAVGFVADVTTVLGSEHLGQIIPLGTVAKVGDGNAGPALGYGCFSGQTQKVGLVAELVRGKHDVKELETILNSALALSDGIVTDPLTLRNAALEKSSGEAAREAAREEARAAREAEYQAKVAKYEQDLAEQQQKVAEFEAAKQQVAEQKAAQAARAQAVQSEYERQKALHQAQVDAANRARAEYEAQLRALGLAPPAKNDEVQCQRATPTSACVTNE